MLLVAIPILLIVSFIFYMLASMDGAMFGTPDGEVENIIAGKLKNYIQEVDEQTQGGASGHVGDSFEKIAFGLKLIPNMDQANYLLKKMSMVGGE